jgi:hypothetical protein
MNQRVLRRKQQGQTIVLIAGALIALLALVALAVDGGNAFAQRRIAQNGTDGAAMAGVTQMNSIFLSNRRFQASQCGGHAPCVNNISADQNASIRTAIQSVLQAHNEGQTVASADFQAWYIKADGTQANYQQVGSFESVPFMSASNTNGVTGVMVTWSKQASTYFARIIGVNSIGADAKSGAQLGSMSAVRPQSAQGSNGPRLWPLTIMQDTVNVNGGTTSLYNFNTGYGPGNWGVLCYTSGSCGTSEVTNWLRNGYDGNNMNLSPTMNGNFQSYNTFPVGNNGQGGGTGVWVDARTGNGVVSSTCDVLDDAVAEHWQVAIPITAPDAQGNATNNAGGTNLRYHIVAIAVFEVTAHDCGGNHNSISGRFIGYGWNSSWTTWEENLDPAITTGQTVLRLR